MVYGWSVTSSWLVCILAAGLVACAIEPATGRGETSGTSTGTGTNGTEVDGDAEPDGSTTAAGPSDASTTDSETGGETDDSTGESRCTPLRSEDDRPDDTEQPQVHVVYALPSDGRDRELDLAGTLASSVAVWNAWLAEQSGGSAMRLDTCDGELDVTFFVLDKTDAEVEATGAYVREEIEAAMVRAGRIAPNKLYAVYYDGSSTYACGGGAFPPALVGRVGALYLRGTPPGAPPCPDNFAAAPTPAGYLEHAMLHELVHSLGLVATCGTTSDGAGHATDDPSDLMYSGPQPWFPMQLDPGNDDYWLHDDPECLDLATSALLEPMPEDAWLPDGW